MKYVIEINEKTDNNLKSLGAVLAYMSEEDKPIPPERIIKGALWRLLQNLNVAVSPEDEIDLTGLAGDGKLINTFKQHLEEKGMTIARLSEQTKLGTGTLSRILNNHNEPTLDIFIKIWIAIGCPPLQHVLYRSED